MTIVKIDNKDYEFESFSEETKAQFINLQFTDSEILYLQNKLAVMQTARDSYAKALCKLLDQIETIH